MDCCLVRVLAFLLSCCVIFGCPHNHHYHKHHVKQHKENSLDSTNLLIKEKPLLEVNQELLEFQKNKEAPKEEIGVQTTVKVNDNNGLEVIEKQGSMTNDSDIQPDNTDQYVECVCALFSLKSPIETDAPLMSKTFHNVSCNDHISAKDACTEVCISFVTSRLGEDNSICAHLYNSTSLTGYVHSKISEEDAAWIFTGLESSRPLCCKNGKPVDCENEV